MTVSKLTLGIPTSPPHFDPDTLDVSVVPGGSEVRIFLDYDGTLTPIVSDPSRAYLASDMRRAITELTKLYQVGVVTGRGRGCIADFLGDELISQVSLAASHGFDIHLQNGKYLHVGDNSELRVFNDFKDCLRMNLPRFPPGVALEESKYCVSVHYRNADEADHLLVENMLDEMLAAFPDLVRRDGKKVMEVRLGIDWNKGKAVDWILRNTNCDPTNCFVIYIGDDVTDEDAFRTVREHYPNRLSIVVCGNGDLGRPTHAEYCLSDQNDVLKLLLKLISLRDNTVSL
jgi:trehalose-phosphatase